MARPVPAEMVAAATALVEELADWCVRGRDQTLAAHEEAVLAAVRRVLPKLLGAVVGASTSGLEARRAAEPAACPQCGRVATPRRGGRQRWVATTCGDLGVVRPWYHCADCERGWSVLETVLGVRERARVSEALRGWLVLLGTTSVFRDGVQVLSTLSGLQGGAETVRRHTEQAGAKLRQAEDAQVAQVERTREPAEVVQATPGVLVAEVDGAMVRFRDGWHEVKLGLVAGWEGDELHEPSYVAARESAERFGTRVAAEAARRGALEVERWHGGVTGRGLAVLRPVEVLGDGAAWIWAVADEHFAERIEVVDAYHAGQHLHAAAQALYGEGPAARAWAHARQAELLSQGVGPVLRALEVARAPSVEAAEVLRRERGYFRHNAERMDYPTLRLEGLPIGSGPIESAADHLVQRRMKRAGMRWSDPGGDALLALRARLRSGRSLLPAPAQPGPHTRQQPPPARVA